MEPHNNTPPEAAPITEQPSGNVAPEIIIEPTMPSESSAEAINPISDSEQPSAGVIEPQVFKPAKKTKRSLLKPTRNLVAMLSLLILLGGGSAAAYFGYYVPNKPENIWATALVNSGKGYDKLSSYATSSKNVKALSLNGAFKISGVVAADGVFSGTSDNNNSQLTGTVSAAGLKVNLDVRSISANGNSPDLYFKVGGISGLGTLLGGAESTYTSALNGLNDKWYVVDHTLFDQFAQGANSDLKLNKDDVSSALKAVGDASKRYVFTDNQQKMVIKVKSNIGKEKNDNRSTYHYKVSVDKNNFKAYMNALCSKLKASKINRFFSGSGQSIDQALNCANNTSVQSINASDSADVWVDLHTKLIHKIRFSDKTNPSNYFDIAQDYQGGDNFPFSIAFNDEQGKTTTTGSIKMTLNMKTNIFTLDGSFKSSGGSSQSGTFNLKIAPSGSSVKVEAPAGAKNIIDLANDLGLSGVGGQVNSSAKDTERKTDINALQSQLEVYYAVNGYYPTLANLNDSNWRKTNMQGFDNAALQDPDGSSPAAVAQPVAKAYAYQVLPVGCGAPSTPCTSYTLTATLEDGSTYAKKSLN